MNCESFENVVVDLARLTPLEASVRDAARAHCEVCDNCARRLTEEKILTGGLLALATEMKAAVVPDQVQKNLLSVWRKESVALQPERANPGWRYLAVAAAILVAVALGIAGYHLNQTPPVDSQVRSLPATEKPVAVSSTPPMMGISGYQMRQVPPVDSQAGSVETETPVEVASSPPIMDSADTSTRKQKPTPTLAKNQRLRKFRPDVSAQSTFVSVVVGTVTDPEAAEVASPFMPLGDTNPANIQEGAQVVRVELPRYAMARFGLPVNMERYDERVKADVWLGADGLARAIRFVQ